MLKWKTGGADTTPFMLIASIHMTWTGVTVNTLLTRISKHITKQKTTYNYSPESARSSMREREKNNNNSKIRHKIVKLITTENKGG